MATEEEEEQQQQQQEEVVDTDSADAAEATANATVEVEDSIFEKPWFSPPRYPWFCESHWGRADREEELPWWQSIDVSSESDIEVPQDSKELCALHTLFGMTANMGQQKQQQTTRQNDKQKKEVDIICSDRGKRSRRMSLRWCCT